MIQAWAMGVKDRFELRKADPSWLKHTIWNAQMPFFVQLLDDETLRKLVQAYSTLEAVPQMLWRPGPDHDPVYVRGGWIDSHIAKIQSAFLTAGQHMDRLQAEVSLLSRLKARLWVART